MVGKCYIIYYLLYATVMFFPSIEPLNPKTITKIFNKILSVIEFEQKIKYL